MEDEKLFNSLCCDVCNEVVCDDDCENIYKRANNLQLLKERDNRIKILKEDNAKLDEIHVELSQEVVKLKEKLKNENS